MSAVPVPEDEELRLEAVRSYDAVGSHVDPGLDRITGLAADIFEVPICLVTSIEEHRQWARSCYGIERGETPREQAFCSYTIMSDEVLVVPDSLEDPRFASNPLVTGPPHIRFYAGAPLASRDGFNVGALCVIDLVPRTFDGVQRAKLRDLAGMVVDELESRILAESVSELPDRNGSSRRFAVSESPLPVPATFGEARELVPGAKTVLYVEDNQSNIRLVQGIFRHRPGVRLLVATGGTEGLRSITERRPDLVLLDLDLPDMGGEEVLAALRRDPANEGLPIVIVSADAIPRNVSRLMEAGANGYLTKPIDVPELLRLVDEVTATGSREKALNHQRP